MVKGRVREQERSRTLYNVRISSLEQQLEICVPDATISAFREADSPAAGSFFKYRSIEHLLADPKVASFLIRELSEEIRRYPSNMEAAYEHVTRTLEHDHIMGWARASTEDLFMPVVLKPAPDDVPRRSWLCVKDDRKDILAPFTVLVTFVFYISFSRHDGWRISLKEVYPGPADLFGQKFIPGAGKRNKDCVLFPLGHPGMPRDLFGPGKETM